MLLVAVTDMMPALLCCFVFNFEKGLGMANAELKKDITIILRLNSKEAEFLRGYLQNDVTEKETESDLLNRLSIFDAINQSLKYDGQNDIDSI